MTLWKSEKARNIVEKCKENGQLEDSGLSAVAANYV